MLESGIDPGTLRFEVGSQPDALYTPFIKRNYLDWVPKRQYKGFRSLSLFLSLSLLSLLLSLSLSLPSPSICLGTHAKSTSLSVFACGTLGPSPQKIRSRRDPKKSVWLLSVPYLPMRGLYRDATFENAKYFRYFAIAWGPTDKSDPPDEVADLSGKI